MFAPKDKYMVSSFHETPRKIFSSFDPTKMYTLELQMLSKESIGSLFSNSLTSFIRVSTF